MNYKSISILAFFFLSFSLLGQNEYRKWYFSDSAALDFMTSPPTKILTSAMSAFEGSASIADSAGNLLFYTDGVNIWNKANVLMANGTGLISHATITQAALIVKKPASKTLYYVFHANAYGLNMGFYYSVVDMSLAAGMGSVTVKNVMLNSSSAEQLSGTYHCNNTDVWVVGHENWTKNIYSYLLTSSGVGSTSVVTTIGNSFEFLYGYSRFSPNGKKFVSVVEEGFQLFDFDNVTGIFSNAFTLTDSLPNAYACEFSPNGTKLYVSASAIHYSTITQWDLCGGGGSIPAAIYSFTTPPFHRVLGAMKLAPDGKIYCVRSYDTTLGVINNPDVAGPGCNYVDHGVSIAPRKGTYGLPNYVVRPSLLQFTSTITCKTASFSGIPNISSSTCNFAETPISIKWNFGDPASASSNTSNALNPTHFYSSAGTYTAHLIITFPCYTDSVHQVLVVGLNNCLGVNEQYHRKAVKIYPNPTSEILYIETDFNEFDVVAYNKFGEEVSKCFSKDSRYTIDMKGLSEGVYFVKIRSEYSEQFYKVVKSEAP